MYILLAQNISCVVIIEKNVKAYISLILFILYNNNPSLMLTCNKENKHMILFIILIFTYAILAKT